MENLKPKHKLINIPWFVSLVGCCCSCWKGVFVEPNQELHQLHSQMGCPLMLTYVIYVIVIFLSCTPFHVKCFELKTITQDTLLRFIDTVAAGQKAGFLLFESAAHSCPCMIEFCCISWIWRTVWNMWCVWTSDSHSVVYMNIAIVYHYLDNIFCCLCSCWNVM